MPHRDPFPEREAQVQQAFDRVAGDLELRPEPPPAHGEVRTIGAAFFIVLGNTVEVNTLDVAPPVGASDDAEIQAVLTAAYSVTPEQMEDNWRDFYHEPFEAVGRDFIARMDQPAIRKWARSPELAQHLQNFPPFNPRQVQITNVNITYIGTVRAAVTYHVQETFQNSQVAAGNALALMVKVEGLGWRILITTKEEMTTVA
jgi:hypothetical protein